MHRVLVAFEDTDRHRELLAEAGDLAAGSAAELVVLVVVHPDEVESGVETLDAIGEVEDVSRDANAVLTAAWSDTEDVVTDVLSDVDVDVSVVAVAAEAAADAILQTADEHECDHVFVAGRDRSPTGKAIFGDTAQRVVLDFDGLVTIVTG